MANGIIFGGYFLNWDQFKPIFVEWYTQKRNDFLLALEADIIAPIETMVKMTETTSKDGIVSKSVVSAHGTAVKIKGAYDASKIYSAWERLSLDYFGNSPVSLLVGAKFGADEFQWSQIVNESELINEKGINVRKKAMTMLDEKMKDINGIYAAAKVQDIINTHFNNLLNQLDEYQLTHIDAIALHQLLDSRKSALNKPGFTGSTYNKIIFGSQRNAAGKQLDAFMNHMGNLHSQVFSLMLQGSISSQAIMDAPLQVENDFPLIFSNPEQVQPWLVDSLNSASWLTGGDIVVVNDKGAVIYNIQLKTTAKGKTFDVAVSSLYSFAVEMRNMIMSQDAQPEELAALMFKRLSTTSANDINNTERFYTEKIYEDVEKNLHMKQGCLTLQTFVKT